MNNNKRKCKYCNSEYDRGEVIRKYGEGFRYGFCNPTCYTKYTFKT